MGSDGNVMAMGESKVANAALQAEKALHSCSPRCNRPPRANPNPEPAEVRHANASWSTCLLSQESYKVKYITRQVAWRVSVDKVHDRVLNGTRYTLGT
jgi:hypothetical protein